MKLPEVGLPSQLVGCIPDGLPILDAKAFGELDTVLTRYYVLNGIVDDDVVGDEQHLNAAGYYQRLRDEAMAAPGWPALNAMLLAVAPGGVVLMPDPHIAEILERGAVVTGKVRVRRGEPNRCHLNACVQWLRDPRARIYTGYAYSGGVWRQHSWNVHGADIIDMYDLPDTRFGVALADPPKFVLYVFGKEFDLGKVELSEIRQRVGVRAELRFREILIACLKSALAPLSGCDAVNTLQLLDLHNAALDGARCLK